MLSIIIPNTFFKYNPRTFGDYDEGAFAHVVREEEITVEPSRNGVLERENLIKSILKVFDFLLAIGFLGAGLAAVFTHFIPYSLYLAPALFTASAFEGTLLASDFIKYVKAKLCPESGI